MPSQKQMLDHHQQQRVLSKTNEIQEYTTRILVLAEHNAKNTHKKINLSLASLSMQKQTDVMVFCFVQNYCIKKRALVWYLCMCTFAVAFIRWDDPCELSCSQ